LTLFSYETLEIPEMPDI